MHEATNWWAEFLSLMVDPAHWAFEVATSIAFDVVLIAGLYNLVFKKIILPKLRRDIHREIDDEHGITHHDNEAS